jgi:hypothetical protein
LKEYAPDADDQRIITILEIVNKLLDADSEYKFKKANNHENEKHA